MTSSSKRNWQPLCDHVVAADGKEIASQVGLETFTVSSEDLAGLQEQYATLCYEIVAGATGRDMTAMELAALAGVDDGTWKRLVTLGRITVKTADVALNLFRSIAARKLHDDIASCKAALQDAAQRANKAAARKGDKVALVKSALDQISDEELERLLAERKLRKAAQG